LPDEVESLLQVVAVKSLCKRAGVARFDAGPKGAVATFRDGAFEDPAALIDLVTRRAGEYKLRPDHTLVIRGDWAEIDGRLKAAVKALAPIADAARRSRESKPGA